MRGDAKGYTLIELLVVMALIGLMMTVTTPRFRYALFTDNLKTATRELTGMIQNTRSEALREQKDFFLCFDLDSGLIWVVSSDMTEEGRALARERASSLPEGVRVLDVWFAGKGKTSTGDTAIRFDKRGYVQPSAVHLSSEDKEFTLVLSPFLEKVKVLDNYVDIEDMG